VKKHDREELAGFREDEGNVVDMGERSVAKGGSKRGGERDEEKREMDP
jgi:hypothetical protein